MESEPTLPNHTVYRPTDLGAVNGTVPIVVFAEGGCRNIGNRSAPLMLRIAAQGYLVVVVAGPASPFTRSDTMRDNNEAPASGAATYSHPRQLREAVDWADRENRRTASRYFGRLDMSKVAAMGVSWGGLQAMEHALSDLRTKNIVMLYSGLFPDGVTPGAVQFAGLSVKRADRSRIAQPALYLYGGEKDIAFPNAESDFAAIQQTPVFAASLKASGHGDELAQKDGGRFGSLVIDWLNWWFKDDQNAGASFTAAGCTICRDDAWSVQRKNLPVR